MLLASNQSYDLPAKNIIIQLAINFNFPRKTTETRDCQSAVGTAVRAH